MTAQSLILMKLWRLFNDQISQLVEQFLIEIVSKKFIKNENDQ